MTWLTTTEAHLLHFRCRALEQLDVSGADDVAVFGQCLGCVVLVAKQDEGVACRATVRLMHEEHPILPVQHLARRLALHEKRQLQNNANTAQDTGMAWRARAPRRCETTPKVKRHTSGYEQEKIFYPGNKTK